MIEIHRIIEKHTSETVDVLASGFTPEDIVYPPVDEPTPEHLQAVGELHIDESDIETLRILVMDACAGVVHEILSLIDGVAGPELVDDPDWVGMGLVPVVADDVDREMLHDEFFESYWRFEALRDQDT